ncbi:MAG: aminotransferase class III-fold pyridoxal phosphate-dependent enzyme, partial [Pseudomonadota bacterium]
GGNPLAMAVGNAVLDVMLEDGFLEAVRQRSLRLKQKLAGLVDRHPDLLKDVRGEGLLLGLECRVPCTELVAAMRDQKMLAVVAADNVVRLLPPLIVEDADMDEAERRLDAALDGLSARAEAAE